MSEQTVALLAPAKVNLVLHVGHRRGDGLHDLCSVFASLDLADRVEVTPTRGDDAQPDSVVCPGVTGPNLAGAALAAYRRAAGSGSIPPLVVRIDKRIPVAAGLAGGSADAAAALRAADMLSPEPLGAEALREIGASVGADVPSQIEPAHALVTGAGERVEPIELPEMWIVLVPQEVGLSTAAVYAEADRLAVTRARLDPDALREVAAAGTLAEMARHFENDLEPAAISLRPELADVRERLLAEGAAAALVSGSGPTTFAVFADRHAAQSAAGGLPGAFVTRVAAARGERTPPGT